MSVLEVRAWLGPQVPHQSHCACRSCPKGGLGLDGRIGGAIWGTDARVLYACTCLCVRVGGCSVAYRSRLSGLTQSPKASIWEEGPGLGPGAEPQRHQPAHKAACVVGGPVGPQWNRSCRGNSRAWGS